MGSGQQRSHALFDRLRTFGRRQDAKNSQGQGESMKEMEKGFFTTDGAEGACSRGMGT